MYTHLTVCGSPPVSLSVNEKPSFNCAQSRALLILPQIINEKGREPSDELKSVAPPPHLLSLSPCGLTHPRLGQSCYRVQESGGRGVVRGGKRRGGGQDQQPLRLAAHRSCHSWEGRMGGVEGGGAVEREEIIQ